MWLGLIGLCGAAPGIYAVAPPAPLERIDPVEPARHLGGAEAEDIVLDTARLTVDLYPTFAAHRWSLTLRGDLAGREVGIPAYDPRYLPATVLSRPVVHVDHREVATDLLTRWLCLEPPEVTLIEEDAPCSTGAEPVHWRRFVFPEDAGESAALSVTYHQLLGDFDSELRVVPAYAAEWAGPVGDLTVKLNLHDGLSRENLQAGSPLSWEVRGEEPGWASSIRVELDLPETRDRWGEGPKGLNTQLALQDQVFRWVMHPEPPGWSDWEALIVYLRQRADRDDPLVRKDARQVLSDLRASVCEDCPEREELLACFTPVGEPVEVPRIPPASEAERLRWSRFSLDSLTYPNPAWGEAWRPPLLQACDKLSRRDNDWRPWAAGLFALLGLAVLGGVSIWRRR